MSGQCIRSIFALVLALPLIVSSLGSALAADAPSPEKKPFFLWMDNSVSVLPYGWNYLVDPPEQTTVTFEHAHESVIGDMFFFVDHTWYHDVADELGDDAAATWYGELSPRLSIGKILNEDLSFTLFRRSLFEVKDVLIAGQYERGEDPDLSEAILLGIGFNLDVREAGLIGFLGKFKYVQLNVYGRAELTEGTPNGFRDMQITMVAGYPIEFEQTRFLIDGYFDWVLGLGDEQSSFHINPQIKLDIGNYWGTPEKLYAGVELDWWWDKYQIKDTSAFDTNQKAISLLVKFHF